MSIRPSTNIGCLVFKVSCGKLSEELNKTVSHYMRSNGPEWTCNRFKQIYTAALNLSDDKPEEARRIYQENSISYSKVTMLPKGPLGVLVDQFLKARRPSVIRRKAAALRFYTSIRLPQVSGITKKQAKKALNAITQTAQPCNLEVGSDSFTPDQVGELFTFCLRMRKRRSDIGKPHRISPSERDGRWLRSMSYYYSPHKFLKGIDLRGPYVHMCNSLNSTEWVPESIDYDTPCYEMREQLRSKGVKDDFVGRIFPIQEQGCKARVVAQPSAWLQLACMPYHKRIADVADHLFYKESNVKRQSDGAWAVQALVANGGKPVCVDLSSATDRFPRSITTLLISELGYPEFSQALDEISSRKWECSFAPNGYVSYSVGQPMGLYGSFPSFHLSNLVAGDVSVLLTKRYVSQTLTSFPQGEYFHVVGDDIIFSDERVANIYKSLMTSLDVPLSEPKCFSNGLVSEFAGFLTLKRGETTTTFRPYKVPDEGWIKNPLQFLHAIGANVKKIPKRTTYWNRVLRAYSDSLSIRDLSLDPLVPCDDNEFLSSNRATAANLVNVSRRLAYSLCERGLSPEQVEELYPCISGETKINRVPLISEVPYRVSHLVGFNPDTYDRFTDDRKKDFGQTYQRLYDDPLIREFFDRLHIKPNGSKTCGFIHRGKCGCYRAQSKACYSGSTCCSKSDE